MEIQLKSAFYFFFLQNMGIKLIIVSNAHWQGWVLPSPQCIGMLIYVTLLLLLLTPYLLPLTPHPSPQYPLPFTPYLLQLTPPPKIRPAKIIIVLILKTP